MTVIRKRILLACCFCSNPCDFDIVNICLIMSTVLANKICLNQLELGDTSNVWISNNKIINCKSDCLYIVGGSQIFTTSTPRWFSPLFHH